MFSDLKVFQMAGALASHAGRRQVVIAQNIANADTPGYRARDIAGFSASYDAEVPAAMNATRSRHIGTGGGGTGWVEIEPGTASEPNRNSVSLELEMMKSVEVKRAHDRALAIYRSSMNILRTSLGRG